MADDIGFEAIAQASNNFSNHFSKTILEEHSENLITSPLSLLIVLAMTAYGAGGHTASQMRSVLRMSSDDSLSQTGFKSIIKSLNAVESVELRVANKIYIAAGFQVKPEFTAVTTDIFQSAIQQIDFLASPATAAATINNWCEQQTNSRIKEIVTKADLAEGPLLILVNAIYFKGLWLDQFDPYSTENRDFFIKPTTPIQAPTMQITHRFRYGSLPDVGARYVSLPYKGNEMSMVIILPDEINGLDAVLDGLENTTISDILQNGSSYMVDLSLPKFRIETTLNLEDTLQKMGLEDMFSPGVANFSGIADEELYVSKIIQKAFIEVNEQGSEAAVVTGLQVTNRILHFEEVKLFNVDRPFKYFICYHKNEIFSLFEGIVRDPTTT